MIRAMWWCHSCGRLVALTEILTLGCHFANVREYRPCKGSWKEARKQPYPFGVVSREDVMSVGDLEHHIREVQYAYAISPSIV